MAEWRTGCVMSAGRDYGFLIPDDTPGTTLYFSAEAFGTRRPWRGARVRFATELHPRGERVTKAELIEIPAAALKPTGRRFLPS